MADLLIEYEVRTFKGLAHTGHHELVLITTDKKEATDCFESEKAKGYMYVKLIESIQVRRVLLNSADEQQGPQRK